MGLEHDFGNTLLISISIRCLIMVCSFFTNDQFIISKLLHYFQVVSGS